MKGGLKGVFGKGEGNVVKIMCVRVGVGMGVVMVGEVILEGWYEKLLGGLKDS